MKFRYLLLSLSFVAIFFLSSYITSNKELGVGDQAPAIELSDGSHISTASTTIVNFWSPKFPASRLANKDFARLSQETGVNVVAICIDDDETLMSEVARIDGIDSSLRIVPYSAVSPKVFKNYGVTDYPRSFRIGPDGKIASI